MDECKPLPGTPPLALSPFWKHESSPDEHVNSISGAACYKGHAIGRFRYITWVKCPYRVAGKRAELQRSARGAIYRNRPIVPITAQSRCFVRETTGSHPWKVLKSS